MTEPAAEAPTPTPNGRGAPSLCGDGAPGALLDAGPKQAGGDVSDYFLCGPSGSTTRPYSSFHTWAMDP